ncbi:MAG: methyltransferase regulatory domain-containing protein [Planctomycetaceae bacterium]
MAESIAKSYDEIPYQGGPFRRSRPRHLATLGALLGLTTPDVDCCRVLELGCAEGGNLIPLAAADPESRFLGIDFSDRQIAVGREMIERLRLTNIELKRADILEIDDSLGTFDYIIAHGVYSWVPQNVRDKVLSVCRKNLNPNGIAYISYNTFPGGRLRQVVRDMMLYHVRDRRDAGASVTEARELLDFVVDSVPENQPAYRTVLEWERRHVAPFADHHVRHDSLSEVNDPCYFYEFMEHAAGHRLQYLADADFSTMLPRNFPPAVFDRLKRMSRSVVEIEQYMDFLRNRSFRETLLCHAEARIDRAVSPVRIRSFYVGSSLKPVDSPVDLSSANEVTFRNPDGGEVKVHRPLSKAALLVLGEIWPRNLRFDEIIAGAQKRLANTGGAHGISSADIDGTAAALLESFAAGLIEFDVRPTNCAGDPGECPTVPALNRLEAIAGDTVTNRRHEQIRLDPLQRAIVPHLNGRTRRGGLIADLEAQSESSSRIQPKQLEDALRALAGAAILIDAGESV